MSPVDVLIAHQLVKAPPPYTLSCLCGWGSRPEHLGRSFAQHQAAMLAAAGWRLLRTEPVRPTMVERDWRVVEEWTA